MTSRDGDHADLSVLSAWAPELAHTFASLAGDIALVVDADGTIRVVAQGGREPIAPSASTEWVGRRWADTVTDDTRAKIEQLLAEVGRTGRARAREVNHPAAAGGAIPVAYTAVRLGDGGPVLVVGRDLRAITAIQQRFLDAQRELERGYWRTRQAEARYRQLFQVATDAVVVVDAQTLRVIEANPSAAQLFDLAPQALPGRRVGQLFARTSRPAVEHLLVSARASGREAEVHAQLLGRVGRVAVSATPFRADDAMRLLVRVRADDRQRDAIDVATAIARLVDGTRDGVVVTDSGGRILHANPAFVALVGEPGEDAVRGQPLSRWLVGERGEPSGVLAAARAQGVVRRIAAALQGARGSTTPVEVSAALLTEGDRECVGVVLNTRGTHQMLDVWPGDALRLALDRLVAQVGETTLPALLREASDLAQRHFIALALQQAGGDAAAAARRLGISRASLRRRQRRLAGTPPAPTDAPASDGQTP